MEKAVRTNSSSVRDPRVTLFVTILTLFLAAALLVGAGVTVSYTHLTLPTNREV